MVGWCRSEVESQANGLWAPAGQPPPHVASILIRRRLQPPQKPDVRVDTNSFCKQRIVSRWKDASIKDFPQVRKARLQLDDVLRRANNSDADKSPQFVIEKEESRMSILEDTDVANIILGNRHFM